MHDLLNIMNAEIVDVTVEAPGLRTFALKPEKRIDFLPGQFVLVSRLGAGESAFAISSDPRTSDTISVSVQAMGKNTDSLHELDPGDTVALRGPYGNSFPLENWKGRNVFVIGGGIGMAPLRPVIYSLLESLNEYASVTLVCGARAPDLLPYRTELDEWGNRIRVHLTVDREVPEWTGRTGVVPSVVTELGFRPENAVAVICGPPIMIKFGCLALSNLGFSDDQVYTTLEMKMKCGVGICGRCNIDHRYICKDGPVFRMDSVESIRV
jgi:sulfhydrogenase subunit gamma (sulfur reductase)